MERDILKFLYIFYSAGDYIEFHSLAPVFEKAKKGDDLKYFFERIKIIINHLSDGRGYIEISNKKDQNQYGSWGTIKEGNILFDYNNLPTFARLTPEGLVYIENVLTNETQLKVSKSILTTNRLTWLNIIAAILFSIMILIIQVKSCNRDLARDHRETNKINQDSLQSLKQLRHDSILESLILQKDQTKKNFSKKK
jgi:hypothetical protein